MSHGHITLRDGSDNEIGVSGNPVIVSDVGASASIQSTTQDGVTVGSSTTQIAPVNANRLYLAIVNDSDEDIYLALGNSAVLNEGIRINANGGSFEMNGTNLFTGIVNGICSSGSKNVTLLQGDSTS